MFFLFCCLFWKGREHSKLQHIAESEFKGDLFSRKFFLMKVVKMKMITVYDTNVLFCSFLLVPYTYECDTSKA